MIDAAIEAIFLHSLWIWLIRYWKDVAKGFYGIQTNMIPSIRKAILRPIASDSYGKGSNDINMMHLNERNHQITIACEKQRLCLWTY